MTATGASFVALTAIVTVAVLESAVPSFALYVKLSLPLKFAAGVYVALPLRRENSALVGFVVLHAPRALQQHVRAALAESLDSVGLALAERPPDDGAESAPSAAAV